MIYLAIAVFVFFPAIVAIAAGYLITPRLEKPLKRYAKVGMLLAGTFIFIFPLVWPNLDNNSLSSIIGWILLPASIFLSVLGSTFEYRRKQNCKNQGQTTV